MRSQLLKFLTPAGLVALVGLMLGPVGCSPREEALPPVASAPAAPSVEPKPSPAPLPQASSPQAPDGQAMTAKVAAAPLTPAADRSLPTAPGTGLVPPPPAPTPVAPPEAKPIPAAAVAVVPAQAPVTSPVSDPGGAIAVTSGKGGLARVGSATCKMCHRVQFASWSSTAHAKRNPPLDCESCHGAGSEYKAMPIMKDPAKAKAAGLVLPGASFCVTCHNRNWNEAMLKKAHAHKA